MVDEGPCNYDSGSTVIELMGLECLFVSLSTGVLESNSKKENNCLSVVK
jgi:hypothetical protein